MNTLTVSRADKHLVVYNKMRTAITACHRIDECKDIADKSVAFAAYYKQIKDDKTVQMFNEVRLRAWRQMGKLFAAVDLSKCETQNSKIGVIRKAFDDPAMKEISDSRIYEILKLSALTDADFESAFKYQLSGSIPDLMHHTASNQEAMRKGQERLQQAVIERQNRKPTPEEIAAEKATQKRLRDEEEAKALQHRHYTELAGAADNAMKEVGITLERKDRAKMKQVVFLIKDEVHALLRQAAFDQKVTMQEILRRGLKTWLLVHDYEFPE
jgi:hypothetical protein